MKKILQNSEIILSSVFLCITVTVVILNVILRYAFQSGLFWVEEVATSAFIWSVFIGAAGAYRNHMHIGIDLVTKLLPERAREVVAMVVNALMVIINGYIFYLSTLFMQANKLKRTPVLDIPAFYVQLSIAVGFGLITIYAFISFIREGRLLLSKQANKD